VTIFLGIRTVIAAQNYRIRDNEREIAFTYIGVTLPPQISAGYANYVKVGSRQSSQERLKGNQQSGLELGG